MTDWKTRAMRTLNEALDDEYEDTVTVEEAEAALAGQAAAYNVLAERLDAKLAAAHVAWCSDCAHKEASDARIAALEAKLAAATRYPHCDSEPDGLCLLEKAEARIAALEAENEALLDKGASDAIAIAALQDELRRPRATIREAMQ
jgi:hypothetical protein